MFIIIIMIIIICEFFKLALADGLSLESLRVSRTLLSILVDLNNAVIWMVSTHPSISNFSSSLNKLLSIVPILLIIIGITDTFMFHIFLKFSDSV